MHLTSFMMIARIFCVDKRGRNGPQWTTLPDRKSVHTKEFWGAIGGPVEPLVGSCR